MLAGKVLSTERIYRETGNLLESSREKNIVGGPSFIPHTYVIS